MTKDKVLIMIISISLILIAFFSARRKKYI